MTPSTIRAVCFDMDGVLIQSREAIEQAWCSIAAEHGIEVSARQRRDDIHGRQGAYTLQCFFGAFPPARQERIKRQVDALEQAAYCPLLPGVEAVLLRLRHAGLPLALVTSSWPEKIQHMLGQHSLLASFATIVTRDDVKHGKPAPDAYLLAAARLGVAARDCLVFEDSVSGVQAAVRSGARCIGIGEEPDLVEHGAITTYPDFVAALTPLIHDFGL